MVCAYLHPHATKVLAAIEELPQPRRLAVRAGIVSAVGLALGVYYHTIYSLPKVEYNKVRFGERGFSKGTGVCLYVLTIMRLHAQSPHRIAGLDWLAPR
jgi:hypothetical protein